MRGYTQLTLAQLRLFARNRQFLFWSMLFPLFLMLMLGSFLGGGDVISLKGTVIDRDGSAESSRLAERFAAQEVIGLKPYAGEDEALAALKQGEVQLVIVIPEGYGQALAAAQPAAKVLLYYDETNMAVSQVGISMVNQVVDQISKEMVRYRPAVSVQAEGVQSLDLQYIDFLVPGIVAMMIMSNNLNGVAGQIASWRERGILRRMQSTTLNASTFIAAQISSRLLLNGLQAVIVLLVGYFVFGTQVNGSWLLLLLFVVLGTLAFMAIGFIIAGTAKNPESAGPIAGFVSFPLLFLGGVFFPIDNMPEFLQPVVKLLPISHLTTALRQVMNVGADLTALWGEALLLCGWMAAAFIVASLTFRWE
jgi:ABC-2 type transport system permease protein